jgi:uncharacterized protein YlxW (UPF0749 family)
MEQVDTYIRAKVTKELAQHPQNSSGLVRELADKAEEVVWKRFKIYTVLFGVLLAVIAWFGYSSFNDITDSAKRRLDPIVNDAVSRATKAQEDVAATAGEVKATKDKLDAVSREADTQKARLDSQSGEASRKLAELQASVDHANKMSAEYDAKVSALTHRMESQYTRMATSVNNQVIAAEYPNIDTEPYVMIGHRRVNGTEKKPGQIWVHVYLSGLAIERHLLTGARFQELLAEMERAGYTPFIGSATSQGLVAGGPEKLCKGSTFDSQVCYFDPSKTEAAERLVQIVNKYMALKPPAAQLVTFSASPDYREIAAKTIVQRSGLDAEVFISFPQ